MDIVTKFQHLLSLQGIQPEEFQSVLHDPITEMEVRAIEALLGEPLPEAVKQLYAFANGEKDNGPGLFLQDRFCTSAEIIQELEISRSMIKPENPFVADAARSEDLARQIADAWFKLAPKPGFLGLGKRWYKFAVTCGVNSWGGPYLYRSEKTADNQREILNVDSKKGEPILDLVGALHALERETYNWDELHFVVYADGSFELQRSFYDFDKDIPFSSTPANAIRMKYFHHKWLPLFSDGGGSYIGIDLDPDKEGVKGQVINFGRDEEDMVVYANSLDGLLDKVIAELQRPGSKLREGSMHPHEALKELR
ncbi:SMI1/KNR4 family protein [Flavihumibacter rivuli]|uniref:SMI1/KNR4 family protein n=1 Tax=Flavihumibacter rivuli TaxID=2838156 RepID=UPI001BDF3730|nr:SMI1/KNR4 family protein [Flavihumibacter rivuli]ULQ55195.1 SMI1/KNR4 family protein [Flavihumibacter rivuli]